MDDDERYCGTCAKLQAEIERLRDELATETGRVNAAIGDAAETFIAERQRDEAIEAAMFLYRKATDAHFMVIEGDNILRRWPWLEVSDD